MSRLGRALGFPALLAAIALLAGVSPLAGQPPDDAADINREYAIKAAYLYQFGHYVQWPVPAFANPQAPLVIGVLGTDPFGGILDEIARTKRIDDRPIVVRRFATMADYVPCHVLFINAAASTEDKAAAIDRLRGVATLVVGEEPGFAEHGAIINFFLEENKIRFEINAKVAQQAKLKISSKLLSLAKIVGHY
jgi:hypothetical protein